MLCRRRRCHRRLVPLCRPDAGLRLAPVPGAVVRRRQLPMLVGTSASGQPRAGGAAAVGGAAGGGVARGGGGGGCRPGGWCAAPLGVQLHRVLQRPWCMEVGLVGWQQMQHGAECRPHCEASSTGHQASCMPPHCPPLATPCRQRRHPAFPPRPRTGPLPPVQAQHCCHRQHRLAGASLCPVRRPKPDAHASACARAVLCMRQRCALHRASVEHRMRSTARQWALCLLDVPPSTSLSLSCVQLHVHVTGRLEVGVRLGCVRWLEWLGQPCEGSWWVVVLREYWATAVGRVCGALPSHAGSAPPPPSSHALQSDPAWPGPCYGAVPPAPVDPAAVDSVLATLRAAFDRAKL